MTGDTDDADLEAHINGFLTALGERPEELIPTRLAEIEQPNPQDADDFRRYVNDLKSTTGKACWTCTGGSSRTAAPYVG